MQNRNIIIIILLMAMALSGLLLLQYYWIKDSIAIKESRFDQTVNDALKLAVYNVEKQETARIIEKADKDFFEIYTQNIHVLHEVDSNKNLKNEGPLVIKTEKRVIGKNAEKNERIKMHLGIKVAQPINGNGSPPVVDKVFKGPAQKAGLMAGDAIVKVNDQAIENAEQFNKIVDECLDLESFSVCYHRKGNQATITQVMPINKKDCKGPCCMDYPNRPFLGIYCDMETADPAIKGIYLEGVVEGGAAELAGLQKGDILTRLGEYDIKAPKDCHNAIKSHKIGQTTQVSVFRNGETHSFPITLMGQRERNPSPPQEWKAAQAVYRIPKPRHLDILLEDRYNASPFLGIIMANSDGNAGVLLKDIVEGSPAEKAGLQKGDIITALNNISITSDTSLVKVLRSLDTGDEVLIEYRRRKLEYVPPYVGPMPPGENTSPSEGKKLAVSEDIEVYWGNQVSEQVTSATLMQREDIIQENLRESLGHIEELIMEKVLSNVPLNHRIKQSVLDSILQTTLEDRGINIPYEYCLIDNKQNTVYASNASAYPDGFPESAYRKKVNQYAAFSQPGELLLHFPGQNKYLLGSSGLMLSSSLLFNLIIILTFAYTIHTIIRQKKLSEMKTDFINNMTHELKTPISTINLACEMLADANLPTTEKNVKRFTGIIRDENFRLQTHVEKVLQHARLEKDSLKLSDEKVNMHDIIKEAVKRTSLQIEKRNGSLSLNLNADAADISGDRLHLTNVIYNLLDNAIKYSKAAPHIEITTQNKGEFLQINVKDNGIGMSKDTIKHIFDKFYRVPTGNLHDVKGFGLGLSYVKIISEAHGGSVSVKSKLNVGSNFEINIPLSQSENSGDIADEQA